MVETAVSEIAEVEVYFALNNEGDFGFGLTPLEAHQMLVDNQQQDLAIRAFSIRVRARKPGVELGPEIDIADRDVEAASVAEGKTVGTMLSDDPAYAAAQKDTADLPEASRASQHSS
jgi:hypothetical protein